MNAVLSGNLRPDHVFYQLVDAGSALFSGEQLASDGGQSGFWSHYPSLTFLAEAMFQAGPAAYRVARGPGYAGNRRADVVPDPSRLLLPLPSEDIILREALPVQTTPGPANLFIRIAGLLCRGQRALRGDGVVLHPGFLCTDGKSLTPAARQHMGEVIGVNVSREDVRSILDMGPEKQSIKLQSLADDATSSVQEFMFTSSFAGRGPLRIGFYLTEENNRGQRAEQLRVMRKATQSCFSCLEAGCECVLSDINITDRTPLARLARPCVRCAEDGGSCERLWVMNYVMDCAAVNAALMREVREASGGLCGPASGILHFLKKLRNGIFRWWVFHPQTETYISLLMLSWLWSAENDELRAAWRAVCPTDAVMNPRMMLSDSLVQMWCRQGLVAVLRRIVLEKGAFGAPAGIAHGGVAVQMLPFKHARFPLPSHTLGRCEGLAASQGGERLLLADAESHVLLEVTLTGIVTPRVLLGVSGTFGKSTGAVPFVLSTAQQFCLSRPASMCILDDAVILSNRFGGEPSNLVAMEGWWPAQAASRPPVLVSVVPLSSVPFSLAAVGTDQLVSTLLDKPTTVQLLRLSKRAARGMPRATQLFSSAEVLRTVEVSIERVRGVCISNAWGGAQAVVLAERALGGCLLLWDFSTTNSAPVTLDGGAEFVKPHSIVETDKRGEFLVSNWGSNQIVRWTKPQDDSQEQQLAVPFAGDGTCRNSSGPMLGCSLAQPSSLLRVGSSYFATTQGGRDGGGLFLLDSLAGIIAYADIARTFSEGHGIVDSTLRGDAAVDTATRVRRASLATVIKVNGLLREFFEPWLAERAVTFGGCRSSALNGAHASPVGATIMDMFGSAEWYSEAKRMVAIEFGNEAADALLACPATGFNNERGIEASFGRVVQGGLMNPAPDALEYCVARSRDNLAMLRLRCSHPNVVLRGANERSTYDARQDTDESLLCAQRPHFASIAALLPTRRDQPPAPPTEVVRAALAFCTLLGNKVATKPVTAVYRPPAGAKQDAFKPTNRESENARILSGVFERPPTTAGAVVRTYPVHSRPGSETLPPGCIVVMMPREELEGEPYWLGELAAHVVLPDEDEYCSTYITIRYLERFRLHGRLFCVGKQTRVLLSRILLGIDGSLEVHQLTYREPSPADLKLKLPSAAVKPLERVYEISEELDVALIAVAAQARSNIAAAAEQQEQDEAQVANGGVVTDAPDENEEARDAAALAAQAARREAAYGEPEAGGRRRPRPATPPQSCDRCGPEAGHTTRRCPLMKAERKAKKNEQGAAAAAEVEAAEGQYERAKRARVEENRAMLHTLGLGATFLQPDV
jgi:hypothetical protein